MITSRAYKISRDSKLIATVSSQDAVEQFGRDACPGVNNIDLVFAEPVDGHTSWRWGTVTKHVHGLVTIEGLLNPLESR